MIFGAPETGSSSALDTSGSPIPLTYGYAWVTGKRHAYYQLGEPLTTGNSELDFTRVGIWLLGHGEWDGPIELWLNDALSWNGNNARANTTWSDLAAPSQAWVACLDNVNQPMVFNFHQGSDSVIGSGLVPSSNGPDQAVDVLYALLPPAIQALTHSRIAYYTIMRKQPIENQTNTNQTDATQWTDIAPIGLWRALRCRLFDDQGNQTGYAFTTNPAWHYVDAILRRKIYPDFGIDIVKGPDPLTIGVQNRFDWGSIFAAAQYFDQILANGRRRFEGNYSFSSQTTLQAVLEQILLCCRSFGSDYAGKIGLNCDMPRSSVFMFSRDHILPGSWNASDQALNKSGNRYIASFRDVLVPECSQIASITATVGVDNGLPIVTTEEPHPFQNGDYIAMGGTGSPYDRNWQVSTVPDVINPGEPDEVDPTTFTLVSQGENFPTSVGAGGGCGLLYSRFKERTPIFDHHANQIARGAIGLGIPRQRTKTKQKLDFATTTWDQASRLTTYERDRLLGIDQMPYVTPPAVKFRTSMFARDAAGNLACAIRPGDHVSIDPTANFQYQGEYEVLDPLIITPPSSSAKGSGAEIALAPNDNSGEIEFNLGPYNEAVMYDTSDPDQAGWPSVPGSDPGNSSEFTPIPLAAGQFAFFTGVGPSGSRFQLPSTGFNPANVLDWAGPAGYMYADHDMETISLCAIDAAFGLSLSYEDGEFNFWTGDVNFACLAWLSSDVTFASGGLKWLALTLLGGEDILFGQGVVAGDGSFTVALPAGWSTSKMFAVAFPHDGEPTTNHVHFVGAYVDSSQVVHLNFKDGAGNVWHGNAAVLVFAWKDNMSTVVESTIGGNSWIQIPLTNGQIFGVGCALGMANGSTLALPVAAGEGETLQAMVGTSGWNYADNGNPATGVKDCYLDAENVVHIDFGNTTGSVVWPGAADIFALYCTPLNATTTMVNLNVTSLAIGAGALRNFQATVLGNGNPNVTWSVDGIPGGNLTVGTIDANGNYTAPGIPGSHSITATAVADGTVSAPANVTVGGSVILAFGRALLTDDLGNPIYVNGEVVYIA